MRLGELGEDLLRRRLLVEELITLLAKAVPLQGKGGDDASLPGDFGGLRKIMIRVYCCPSP